MKTNLHYLLIAWEKNHKDDWPEYEDWPEDIDNLKSHPELAKYDRGFLEFCWGCWSEEMMASWLGGADGETLLRYLNDTECRGNILGTPNFYRAEDPDYPIEKLEELCAHPTGKQYFLEHLKRRTIGTTAREQKELS